VFVKGNNTGYGVLITRYPKDVVILWIPAFVESENQQGVLMKNFKKLLGINALLVIIVFSMTGCKPSKDDEFPSDFIGIWDKDLTSAVTHTLTFTSNILKDSNQSHYWELKNVSDDKYTIKASTSDYSLTITIRLENKNLIINGVPTGTGYDWDGQWRKR
jgi:hypothetical protein